jgi:P pilus assembly chaperone PapD
MTQKKQRVSLFLLIFVVGIFVSLIFSLGIFAQNQSSVQSLEVSPPSQELLADPGQTVVATAKVRNKSRETLPVTVRIEDFTASGEEGQVALTDQGPYSLTNWAVITPKSFSLPPGEEQEVTATIKVPTNKVAGGYYGSFVFSVKNEAQGGGMASVGQEIASLFLLKVSGPVSEQLTLDSITAPAFLEFGPVPLNLKFTNTGNIHTKVYGLVNISDMFGQKVADLVVNQTNVFPGASRNVKTTLEKQLLFGRFTATAIMYYGTTKNETLTAVGSFTVIPYRIIALLIVAGLLLFIMRKRIRKALRTLMS